ncbi:MAG: hypothetical protein ACREVK_07830 [Gammaproteobacteria bacterium]
MELRFLVHDAQAVFFPQRDHEFPQSLIGDPGAELPVERVTRRLPERIAVYVVDAPLEGVCFSCWSMLSKTRGIG